MPRNEFVTTINTLDFMTIVLCYLDFLWWWEILDY